MTEWIRPNSVDDVEHLIGYHVETRRRRHGRPGRPSKYLILRRQGSLLLATDILGQEIALAPGHDPPDPTLSRQEYRLAIGPPTLRQGEREGDGGRPQSDALVDLESAPGDYSVGDAAKILPPLPEARRRGPARRSRHPKSPGFRW